MYQDNSCIHVKKRDLLMIPLINKFFQSWLISSVSFTITFPTFRNVYFIDCTSEY